MTVIIHNVLFHPFPPKKFFAAQQRTVLILGHLLWYTIPDKKKEEPHMNCSIEYVNGHIEVYDETGAFLFSADTRQEALEELKHAA